MVANKCVDKKGVNKLRVGTNMETEVDNSLLKFYKKCEFSTIKVIKIQSSK